MSNVTIAGTTRGITGTSYAFTATVSPPTATVPITCIWQATMQSPVTHTAYGPSDTAAFTWTVVGKHALTVTAVNCGSSDVATRTIAIRVYLWDLYLPVLLRGHP